MVIGKDFMTRVLLGEVVDPRSAIYNEIDAWHDAPGDESTLPDWLGLDDEEYKEWFDHPDRLEQIIVAHRVRQRAWPEPPAPARLPEGWERVYEPYYSCSAYVLYQAPSAGPDTSEDQTNPDISVCGLGVSFDFIDHLDLSREDWDALMGAVHDDFASFRAAEDAARERWGDTSMMTPREVLDRVRERWTAT